MKTILSFAVLLAGVFALPFLTVSLLGQCPPYTEADKGPCTNGLPNPIPTCKGVGVKLCPTVAKENDTVVQYDVNSTSNWVQAPTANKTYTKLSSTPSLCWTRYNCYWDTDDGACQKDETTAFPHNWFPYENKNCPQG